MDDIQIKAVNAIKEHMNCLSGRNTLKGILADYLLDDKMHINLILNAYDDEFHLRIQNSEEKSLTALQFIKILVDDYGISEKNAKWSVEVWCAVLGYQEIAEAFSFFNVHSDASGDSKKNNVLLDEAKSYDLGLGVFCAGIDFPSGRIALSAKWAKGEKNQIEYAIGDTPDIKKTTDMFTDKLYVEIEEGQFLLLRLYNDGYMNDLKEIKAKKVSD